MSVEHRNVAAGGGKIATMSIYNEDSTGRRIAWARKNVEWVDSDGKRHKGMTGHQLGRRLVTQGTVTGVRNVYVSQLENNHASPSLPMLCKIAEVCGVTVGFLLMETDYPYRDKPEPEPVYFSPEADAAAQLIDNAPPEERPRIVAVVQAMAATVKPATKEKENEGSHLLASMPAGGNSFAKRLIASEGIQQRASV